MFISSTAYLPSSFAMYTFVAACGAWWHQRFPLAIFFTALGSLLGIAVEKHAKATFLCTFFSSLAVCSAPGYPNRLRHVHQTEELRGLHHVDIIMRFGHFTTDNCHRFVPIRPIGDCPIQYSKVQRFWRRGAEFVRNWTVVVLFHKRFLELQLGLDSGVVLSTSDRLESFIRTV